MLHEARHSAQVLSSLALAVLIVLFTPLVADRSAAPVLVAEPSAASVGFSGFLTSGIQVRALPAGALPFEAGPPMALAGDGLVDAKGVRMFSLHGRIWDHPVAQAQYALRSLDAYRLTGSKVYLERAIANAQRLVDRRVVVNQPAALSLGKPSVPTVSWFYPYPFDFLCCQGDTTMGLDAPWYSAMAQGEALSAFVRLFEVTGNPAWRVAAGATFASLLVAPSAKQPWVVWVDADGHLWLEEYPRWPEQESERVLNGQIYAAFGLYDYIELTNDPRAIRLFDGAVTTAEQLLPTKFRRVNQAAAYSLEHGVPNWKYQQKVVAQFLYLQHMTGRTQDAILADMLRTDFPLSSSRGLGKFSTGAHRAYLLDGAGKVIASRSVTFTRQTSAPVDHRERVPSGAILLRVSAGAYANWWFREGVGTAWISGPVDRHDYSPLLTVRFSPGSFNAYSFDKSGNRTDSQTVSVTSAAAWPTDSSAIVDGRLAYHFTSAPLAGFWVPAGPGVTVG